MTQLKQLSEKIKKAVPSVYSVGMWVAGKLIKGKWRPISLEDVLMALKIKLYEEFGMEDINNTSELADVLKVWELGVPLSEQSKETINQLNKML